MPKNMCCNLASLNLSEFVKYPYTEDAYFSYEEFDKAIYIAIEALDNIIDENLERHALKEQANNSKNYRNVGLGVMGYANTLFKLGVKYGSKEALEFTEDLFQDLLYVALKASCKLAKEKGAFPKCKPEKITQSNIVKNISTKELIEDIKTYGLRNCSLISIAPTGSIATLLGISGGLEPEFALSYKRKTDNLKESYDMYCKSVKEYWKMTDNTVDIDDINALPSYFVTSKDIPWIQRINTQAIIQKYVDTAISSTINLPEDITIEEIEHIYLYAWEKGLKGVTIYRSGCQREGILVTDDKSVNNDKKDENCIKKCDFINEIDTLPRGYVVDVSDDLIGYKRKISTGCGSIHLEVYSDDITGEPQETFINIGSSGGCERNYQFISRLISTALRGGVPIESIIDQAMSIRPCNAYVNRTKTKGDTSPGTSCPSAIGYALKDLNEKMHDRCFAECEECTTDYKDNIEYESFELQTFDNQTVTTITIAKCPDCGEQLSHEGMCIVCHACGYSKCD